MSFGVLDGDGQVAQIEGHPFGRISFTGVRFAQADVRLLSPILPSKVVAIGKNYADHIEEMKGMTGDAPTAPLMFLKPSTSVIGPGGMRMASPGPITAVEGLRNSSGSFGASPVFISAMCAA